MIITKAEFERLFCNEVLAPVYTHPGYYYLVCQVRHYGASVLAKSLRMREKLDYAHSYIIAIEALRRDDLLFEHSFQVSVNGLWPISNVKCDVKVEVKYESDSLLYLKTLPDFLDDIGRRIQDEALVKFSKDSSLAKDYARYLYSVEVGKDGRRA